MTSIITLSPKNLEYDPLFAIQIATTLGAVFYSRLVYTTTIFTLLFTHCDHLLFSYKLICETYFMVILGIKRKSKRSPFII